MADNYLEKKMEEHRRAPAPAMSRRISPLGTKAGTACLPFGRPRILVTGCDSAPDVAETVVKALGDTGSTVFFVCSDLRQGRALAQATATRHIPLPPEHLEEARRAASKEAPVDFEISISQQAITLNGSPLIESVNLRFDAGQWLIYLLLPQSRLLGLTKLRTADEKT